MREVRERSGVLIGHGYKTFTQKSEHSFLPQDVMLCTPRKQFQTNVINVQ